ncbi:hypothetical protein ACHQM5_018614 [Ranunculus cassubicifolius]
MALCFSLSPSNSLVHFSQGSSSESRTLFTHTSSFHKLPGKVYGQSFPTSVNSLSSRKSFNILPRCSGTSPPEGGTDESKDSGTAKVPFGYSRKDVLLIGVGVTLLGIGLKSGLEFVGVDPLQAGNVVQLVLVLGLTIGWISTYIFRVSNKEMTYATQLRQYESKVMEKRLEGLTEAELQVLLEQVEEEKQSLASGKKGN